MPYLPLHPDLPNKSIFNTDHLAHIENGILGALSESQEYVDAVAVQIQAGQVTDAAFDAAVDRAAADGRLVVEGGGGEAAGVEIIETQPGAYQFTSGPTEAMLYGLTTEQKLPSTAKSDLRTEFSTKQEIQDAGFLTTVPDASVASLVAGSGSSTSTALRTKFVETAQNTERTTEGIQTALNSGAEIVRLIPGEYNGTGTLIVPHTVRELVVPAGFHYVQGVDSTVLTRTGAISEPLTTVSGSPAQGDQSVTVSSAAGLAVGDWVLLTSETAIPGGATSKVGMMRRVTSITNTTLGLDRPLHRPLTSSPALRKYTLAPPLKIHGGGRFEFSAALRTSGTRSYMAFAYCDAVELGDITLGHGPRSGVLFGDCVTPVVDGLVVEKLEDNGSSGSAITYLGATRDGRVVSGAASNVRHGFTTLPGHTTYGEPEDFYIGPGYVVRNTSAAGIDTHQQGAGGLIEPNVSGCQTGVQTRSRGVTVRGGLIAQSTFYGIHVDSAASGTVLDSPVVRGVASVSTAAGIRASSPTVISNPTVMGFGSLSSNYAINAAAPVTVTGGVIDGDTASDQRAFYLDSSGSRIRGTHIRNVHTGIRESAGRSDNSWKQVEFSNVARTEDLTPTYVHDLTDTAFAYKATPTVVSNSTTVVTDADLTVPVAARAVYMVEVFAVYESTTVADFKASFTAPGGSTFDWAPLALATNVTSSNGNTQAMHRTVFGSVGLGGAGMGSPVAANFTGLLTVGITSGSFAFQFAQNSAEATDTTLRAGSFLRATRVA